MGALLVVVAIAVLIFLIIVAKKESEVTGTYKAFGVYGRIKAYLFCDFIFAGIAMFITGIATVFAEGEAVALLYSLLGVGLFALGILIYKTTAKKCPDFLKKKLLKSMLISGWGVAIKLCVFFFTAIWAILGPQEVVDSDGRKLMLYDGKVYTQNGEYVGEASDDGKSYIKADN